MLYIYIYIYNISLSLSLSLRIADEEEEHRQGREPPREPAAGQVVARGRRLAAGGSEGKYSLRVCFIVCYITLHYITLHQSHVDIYIYIYIERERDTDIDIHIHTHIHTYIHIGDQRGDDPRHLPGGSGPLSFTYGFYYHFNNLRFRI